jgi:hypothetical protein
MNAILECHTDCYESLNCINRWTTKYKLNNYEEQEDDNIVKMKFNNISKDILINLVLRIKRCHIKYDIQLYDSFDEPVV